MMEKLAQKPRRYLIPRRYYMSLYEIVKAMTSSLRICDVMNAIVENTAVALDAKACSIILLSPDKADAWYGSSYGLSEWYKHKGVLHNTGDIGKCCAERQPVAISRATEDRLTQYPEAAKAEGIASFLFVPLILRGD